MSQGKNTSSRRSNRARGQRAIPAVVAVAALSLVIAGCSSGSDSAQKADSVSTGSAEAAAKVEAALGVQSWAAPGPGFKFDESLRGKTLFYVGSINDIPFAQQMITGLKQATELLGMQLVVTDMQGSSANGAKLIEQATSQNAAAIVVQGTQGRTISEAVKSATKAGVPVIQALQQDPGPLAPEEAEVGIFGNVAGCFGCQGTLLADFVASQSSNAVVAVINSPDLQASVDQTEGFKKELAKMCPDCKVKVSDLPASRWATGLASTTNAILADPEVDYIFPAFDAMVTNIVPAIRAAGADHVSIITANASKGQLQDIQQGNMVDAEIGGPGEWIGWAMVDMALRALHGLPAVEQSNLPIRMFTDANIDAVDLDANPPAWFSDDDVTAEYAKLWGLSQ